jgi:3-phenylpropionate/cinnamic acid dioxygenase small subunit
MTPEKLKPAPADEFEAAFGLACCVIEDEGLFLDEGRWDDWIALFAKDVRYWVPTWRSDGQLTSDPEVELSHIFYTSRTALEDRVTRFTSMNSPASNPPLRTTHLKSAFRLVSANGAGDVVVSNNWATHIFFPQSKETRTLFGVQRYNLVAVEGRFEIKAKTVFLKNDYISTMLDLYCL